MSTDIPTDKSGDTAQRNRAPTTLMLLEPDVIARMTIAEYLRDCGYKVIEGDRAEEVFTILTDGMSIDIVLSRVHLAGPIDGFELARTIRREYGAIDVILTAGVANTADKVGKLCDNGPRERPCHPQELLRRIRLVQRHRVATGT